MNMQGITNVLGAIVTLATVTVIVSNRTTATIIDSFGKAFAGSLRAAMGK